MRNRTALFITLMAGIGGVLYGYDLGIIAGALLFIKNDIALTTAQDGTLAGAVLFGGAIATLITGPLCDWLGRRLLIIASGLIFIIGVIFVVYANTYQPLLIGRLIQGIGVGIVTIAIPLYLSETTPPNLRGRGVTTFQLLLTMGILTASLIGLYFTKSGDWRGMFTSALVPGIIFFIGSLFLPESPRWLCIKGKYEAAHDVLRMTMTDTQAQHELEIIQYNLQHSPLSNDQHVSTKSSLFQMRYLLPFAIVLCVACLQQLSGINAILQLDAVILKANGLHTNIVTMLSTTAISGLNFIVTAIALLLIDKIGRRPLLCLGTMGMTIAMAYSGFLLYMLPPSPDTGFLLLIGILLFISLYAVGPGVIVWLVISELLPSRIRGTGMAITLFCNSMISSVFTASYLNIVKHIGYSGVFWLNAGFSFLYFLIAWFAIPETKNKSLEEIETHFTFSKTKRNIV